MVMPPRLPPSPPPPPLPTPSAAARELALKMLERVTLIEGQARSMMVSQLRWQGSGCDFQNAECRRIAEEIAAREAPALAQTMREALSRVLGAKFDQNMSTDQIAEASRFFGSEAGRTFIGSFFLLGQQDFRALEPSLGSLMRRREDLAAEFSRRTQHLPRSQPPTTADPEVFDVEEEAPPSEQPPKPPRPPRG